MDKQYLRKRHNVWWVRMGIPAKAKDIVGKTELWKNLYTKDLAEANRKKHKEIGLMYEEIAQAIRNYEGMADKLSKEVQISKYAEYLLQSTVSEGDRYDYYGEKDYSDDHSIVLGNLLEGKLDELSGSKEADAILHGDDPQWQGIKPNSLAKKNFIEAHKLTDQSYSPLSLVSKKFLAEVYRSLKNSSYRRKQTHIEHFIKWTGNRDILFFKLKKNVINLILQTL